MSVSFGQSYYTKGIRCSNWRNTRSYQASQSSQDRKNHSHICKLAKIRLNFLGTLYTQEDLNSMKVTHSDALEFICRNHFLNQGKMFLSTSVHKFSKLMLQRSGNISVHVPYQKNSIIKKNAIGLLETHIFDLKCIFMNLFQISDSVLRKLPTFFKLTSNKNKFG